MPTIEDRIRNTVEKLSTSRVRKVYFAQGLDATGQECLNIWVQCVDDVPSMEIQKSVNHQLVNEATRQRIDVPLFISFISQEEAQELEKKAEEYA